MSETATNDIVSERVAYPNVDGKKVVAYIDARARDKQAPTIVLTPKYGETKKNGLQLAYYLAANGFRVVRFDFTSHFGESEGDMLQFTLGEAADNVVATLDFLERTYATERVTLLASSLSSLVAVRVAAQDRRVAHLVSIVGVVDLTYTLVKVYQEDLVGGFLSGRRFGVLDILGHEVDMDRFFEATTRDEFHLMERVAQDITRVKAPISWFPAVLDTWVRVEDVEAVAKNAGQMKLYPIEGAMHEVRENRDAIERVLHKVVSVCRARYFSDGLGVEDVVVPSKRAVLKQNRVEREQLRLVRPITATEDQFWSQYLGKYRVMEKMDDFQRYLDLIGDLIGVPVDNEVILDAGCGNGLFGVWVIRKMMQRRPEPLTHPPVYVGLDLTRSGLCDAVEKHTSVAEMMGNASRRVDSLFDLVYVRGDLDWFGEEDASPDQALRFADNSFDKILCSLLLSYLRKPLRLLTQLHRVLKPGGRIVVSSMKPFCDLSAIYRDFVEQKASRSEVESARDLLRAAGALKVKEEQGYYVFYSAEELASMLDRAGFSRVECFGSLGNQAKVAVGFK